jgi:hypothetical protein
MFIENKFKIAKENSPSKLEQEEIPINENRKSPFKKLDYPYNIVQSKNASIQLERLKKKMISQRILNQDTVPDAYQAKSGASKDRDTVVKPESEINGAAKSNDFIEPIHKIIALKDGVTYCSKRIERSLKKHDS